MKKDNRNQRFVNKYYIKLTINLQSNGRVFKINSPTGDENKEYGGAGGDNLMVFKINSPTGDENSKYYSLFCE
ncbi:hypothetical protein Q5M86_03340, partial [Brachyspira innocens]